MMKVSVIGAGNGGQAIAGWMASQGHRVFVFDRNINKIKALSNRGQIDLIGAVKLTGKVEKFTTSLDEAIADTNIIMICTTATAHRDIAELSSAYLKDGQIIVLNPGRTCGALEFKTVLLEKKCKANVLIAEAQTLVFACRIVEDGLVNIIGIKDRVLLSAIPACNTSIVLDALRKSFSCFYPANNVLQTSFENIGAMFHPCVVLFNEAAIERGTDFFFYRDMTKGLSRLIEEADRERLAVAKAYGYEPISAKDWVAYAYSDVKGDSLCERMQNNPAYFEILAPKSINCRQITEDIPTGIVPLAELGRIAGVPTPLFDSIICMCSFLLDTDFRKTGRNLKKIGFDGLNKEKIILRVNEQNF